jgi:hypothetical protein
MMNPPLLEKIKAWFSYFENQAFYTYSTSFSTLTRWVANALPSVILGPKVVKS